MLLSTAEDLAKFVSELRRETDRGLPLVASALIDDCLAETLKAFFRETSSSGKLIKGGNAPLATFSARSEACHALGLIDDYEYTEISIIRKIRNEFAHAKHGISFNTKLIESLCTSLITPLPPDDDYKKSDLRLLFMNSVVSIVLRLYHRADWVALERRQAKIWVDPDVMRWRSIKDEPPPKDVPVMVMMKSPRSPA